jgi:predicted outer membrane protein
MNNPKKFYAHLTSDQKKLDAEINEMAKLRNEHRNTANMLTDKIADLRKKFERNFTKIARTKEIYQKQLEQ